MALMWLANGFMFHKSLLVLVTVVVLKLLPYTDGDTIVIEKLIWLG